MNPHVQIRCAGVFGLILFFGGQSFAQGCTALIINRITATTYCFAGPISTQSRITQPLATVDNGPLVPSILYSWEFSLTSSGPFEPSGRSTSSPDLTIPNRLSTSYWRRKVVLEGTSCSHTSDIVAITMEPVPKITNGPVRSENVCAGSGTQFIELPAVSTTPATPFSLQWQIDDGVGFRDIAAGGVFTGETSQRLNIRDVTGLGDARFQCVVTNATPRACTSKSAVYSLHELPLPETKSLVRELCEQGQLGTAHIDLRTLEAEVTLSLPERAVAWNDPATNVLINDPAHFRIVNTATVRAVVSNTTTGCETSAEVTLNIKPTPLALVVPPASAICSGTTPDMLMTGGEQLTWTVNSPPEVTGATPGEGDAIHDVLVNTGATTMTVIYVITPTENGCTGPALPVDIEVLPALHAYAVTGGGSLCEGDAGVVVGLSDSQPNVDYALRLNGTAIGTIVPARGGLLAFPLPVNHAGEYTAVATIVGKCETPMTGSVAVVVNTTPQGTGIITGESDICEGTLASYTASGWTNVDDYRWTLSPELSGASADGAQKEVMADVSGTATMIVEPHNHCGAGVPAQKSITLNPKPTGTLVAPERVYVGTPFIPTFQTTATITQWQWAFGDGDVAQQSQPEKNYAQPGRYTLSVHVTDTRECTETIDTEIAVEEVPVLNVYSIKNVITANGDPENGFLFVENLDKFPANEVVLINRWGGEVFRQQHYANDWDARGSNGFLPAGNYVCIVRLTDKGQTFSRAVTIVRD